MDYILLTILGFVLIMQQVLRPKKPKVNYDPIERRPNITWDDENPYKYKDERSHTPPK